LASKLGGYRLRGYAQRPAIGTRGGILLLWNEATVRITDISAGTYSHPANITVLESSLQFKITTVYGPTRANLKDDFYNELIQAKPPADLKWLVTGDFNQIYRASDKNRDNSNQSRINRFRDALNTCELKEIHLQNRKYTWSNEQQDPTMSKLDGFFCNEEWDIAFATHILNALSSGLSDHCPLLLAKVDGPRRTMSFRFENFWTKMPGFKETVQAAWNIQIPHVEPCQRLFHKLSNTSSRLRKWSKSLFSKAKVEFHMANEIILRLDIAQESRTLSPQERDLRARLKRRILGLAVLERSRKHQSSCVRNLKEGDANTRFFHLRINGRRRKNLIHRLKNGNGWVTEHNQKKTIIHEHFKNVTKKALPRTTDFNWANIPIPTCDLFDIGDPFTDDEVKRGHTWDS
jgi:hypothetical protein